MNGKKTKRKTKKQILNDRELKQDQKNRDHDRKQKILDWFFNWPLKIAIIIIGIYLLTGLIIAAFIQNKVPDFNSGLWKSISLYCLGLVSSYLLFIFEKK